MTNGTSQGLFIVVAIVIFGIFVGISYTVFGDTLAPKMETLFNQAIETVNLRGGNIEETIYPEPTYAGYFTTVENSSGITITEYIGTDSDVVIPKEIDNKPVTVIGGNSFRRKNLSTVIIPNTVTEIGSEAFYRNNLTKVNIPESVTTLGRYAFNDNNLTEIELPKSLTLIGTAAFAYNNLTEVVIPNSVTKIGDYAFYSNSLTEVTIPDSVATIEDLAFYGNDLTEVEIHENTVYSNKDDKPSFEGSVAIKKRK